MPYEIIIGVTIALSIFVGFTMYSALAVAIFMNKRFMKMFTKRSMDITNEIVKEAMETEITRENFTEAV